MLNKVKKQFGNVAEKVSEQAIELGGKADLSIDKSEPPQNEEEILEDVSQKEMEDAEEFASRIMRHAASLNGVKIDRAKFLRTEIKKNAPYADVDLAV